MNGAKTAYLEKKLLNMVLLGETYTPSATVYLALLTSDPGREGSIAGEIADPAYERQAIIFTAAADGEISGSFCKNAYDLEWAQATVDWGIVTHAMIMDAATGGNGLFYSALAAAKEVKTDDFFKIPAGELVVTED